MLLAMKLKLKVSLALFILTAISVIYFIQLVLNRSGSLLIYGSNKQAQQYIRDSSKGVKVLILAHAR